MPNTPNDHELIDAPLALLREAQEQIAALIASGFTGVYSVRGKLGHDELADLKYLAGGLSDVIGDMDHLRTDARERAGVGEDAADIADRYDYQTSDDSMLAWHHGRVL